MRRGLRDWRPISPDGRWIAAVDPVTHEKLLHAVDGSDATRRLPGVGEGDGVVGWSSDGSTVYVWRPTAKPASRIDRVVIATGETTLWRALGPEDRAGVVRVTAVQVMLDGDAHAYRVMRVLSDLYLLSDGR